MKPSVNNCVRTLFAKAIRLDTACTLDDARVMRSTIREMEQLLHEVDAAIADTPDPDAPHQLPQEAVQGTYLVCETLAHLMNANRGIVLEDPRLTDSEVRHAQQALGSLRQLKR